MFEWFLNIFRSKPKEFEYPRKIETLSGPITQTGPSSYLVGSPKPLVRTIPISTFDYLQKPESERVAKPSPYFNSYPLDGYTIKENKMNTEQLQTQLMQAVAYHFDKDAIRPGVVTSSLRNGKIYASVVRYGKQFTGGKQVVCKVQGADLKDVLTDLSVEFLSTVAVKSNPVESLKQLVADKKKDK